MKKNLSKRILAFLLVVMLAIPASFCAFAEEPEEPEKTVIEGDVTDGLVVRAGENEEEIVEVTGSVSKDVEESGALDGSVAVYINAVDGTAEVTVGEDVEASTASETAAAFGLEIYADNDGEVTVTVGDDVEAAGGQAYGIFVQADDGEVEVVADDVTATETGAESAGCDSTAVFVRTGSEDSEATVIVDDLEADNGVVIENQGGDITVETGEINAEEEGIQVHITAETNHVEISKEQFDQLGTTPYNHENYPVGDLSDWYYVNGTEYLVEFKHNADGTDTDVKYYRVDVIPNTDAEVSITTHGDVNVENEDGYALGVQLYRSSDVTDADMFAEIHGSVNVEANTEGDYNSSAHGVYIEAYGTGDTTVIIDEDVNVTSEGKGAWGVTMEGGNNQENVVFIGGSVNVKQTESDVELPYDGGPVIGVDVLSGADTTTKVTVGEGINVTSEIEDRREVAKGISAYASGKDSVTEVNVLSGGITVAADNGDGIAATTYNGGEVDIKVVGNVTATEDGAVLKASKDSSINLIVDGTLSGGEASIVLQNSSTTADNVTVTVWAVTANEEGHIAEREYIKYNTPYDEEGTRVQDEEFEKQIQYIIKLEPNENATLSTEGTTEYEGYNVAHEGDTVVLKVNVADGYHIVNAYNGTDTKVELLQDENGNYYLVVPRGGAVLLSVTLEADAPAAPAPAPAPAAEVESAPAAPVYTYVAPKATMSEVKDSPETTALKNQVESAINAAATASDGDIFSFLPATIKAQIPESFKKIGQILTLELINYKDNMGEVSFTVKTEKQYTAGEEAFVLFIIPGEEENILKAKAVGQADGTLKITPDVETLKQLANKKFVTVILDKEEAAK